MNSSKGPTSFLEGDGLAEHFLRIEREQIVRLKDLTFLEPVQYVYNPLDYAWEPHQDYVRRYCQSRKEVLFLGMNPGPFGMAQTGVPFGAVQLVRDWLQVCGQVSRPANEHPKRPIRGLECPQTEVSGARFWGFFRSVCAGPEMFFRHCFVHNHCPLLFISQSGRNLTPADLPAAQREQLLQVCDDALCEAVKLLGVAMIIGVGRFAEQRARKALSAAGIPVRVEGVMHPSPRNPQANKGWDAVIRAKLEELGVMALITG
ncbi:single-strand selective monofunctional uracil DNA glycosylase isoform X1 [Hemicordylus capensis]|uniref:single-strand selective monofunctional uracil DNA glycosylase isoform X1 n=1 Tax=Hemicordylus capensis TaxID=884348 RepID=UPI002303FB94|nr:single-strand selective monofunctional uracil DNA glycosylase isoform X1 [Hemicordylus capensis]XP_053152939.1 single-strand selective monofunctional uracil DNA glycosylase isoform X1 [Hemicordylus capensis]XP_053152940.1 single-strand selective monofunctional uracil DNA glycosylase isoform X1 [Hemicordylus capensis]XP_053152941.1 single-strand selective monofunctional uracil DNA glycosylase isoform X1 [Hemicordylus capensis]XP_053152942.1 single-strand selective monofunctional uracil DNA gl